MITRVVWLCLVSGTTSGAAGASNAPSTTTSSSRMPLPVTLSINRANQLQGLQHATRHSVAVIVEATCNLCCSHDVSVAVTRVQHVISRCEIVGSVTGCDAEPPCISLRNMEPWLLRTLSWLSHTSAATPAAAGASAAPSGTMPCSRVPRSVTQATMRMSEQQHATSPCVAAIVEATCNLGCSARWHGCPTLQPRHQQLQERRQHRQKRCHAHGCHA